MESPLFDYWLNLILRVLLVFALGMVVGYKWCEKQIEEEYDDDSDSSDESDEEEDENPDYSMKMVLCVRRDLPMTKGKACAQCCHAAVGAVGRARKHTKETYKTWCRSGCKKVALSCPDLDTYTNICHAAEKAGLTYYAVCDAGRTQLEPNTFTVVAIGPDKEERIDKITGKDGLFPLKLY
ncbi:hypothetical protein BLSTO_03287 [Blastocystis sp. subtype 1]